LRRSQSSRAGQLATPECRECFGDSGVRCAQIVYPSRSAQGSNTGKTGSSCAS
jgi:hypothetical protein